MSVAFSLLITKILCDNRGCLDFERLKASIEQHVTVADSILQSVLSNDGSIAIKRGKRKAVGGQLSPDSLIVAKTSLRLCQTKQCLQCDALHLCRFLVCGKCRFGNSCKNPHNLHSGNNQEVLKRQGLQGLTEKQLFQLLLQNDPCLLPEVCSHYNKGEGLHGSCKFNTACAKLHICQHYLTGDCKFGPSCKRAHKFNINEKKLFQFFSQEHIENLFQTYRNRFIITMQEDPDPNPAPQACRGPALQSRQLSKPELPVPSKPTEDADKNEICLFFIRRKCSYKEKCARVHWHLPYRWQVLDRGGMTWNDLPNMEEIERAYCDPRHDNSSMEQPSSTHSLLYFLSLRSSPPTKSPSVDFVTMMYKQTSLMFSAVRRLSTASSVSKPPHFILTTEWLWYWKDDGGQWQEFGKGNGDTQASLTSPTLENLYSADRDGEIPFSAGNQQYILHFDSDPEKIYQQNVKYKTKREIRRRPRFVSAQEVEIKLTSVSSHSPASTAESLPSNWDKIEPPDYEYKLISLSKSVEYDRIEKLFKRTMPMSTIHQIRRIQNPSLWKVFHWQKEQMMKKNEGKTVNQLYLFHGTDESLIEAICEQNFDWRICGTHGTVYGKGSYFARDASYSDRYARGQRKIMFVALVLVGEYTKGNGGYVRPPPKRNGKGFYDSCVDTESNPSIYVIFEKQQIYPEYLIQYS